MIAGIDSLDEEHNNGFAWGAEIYLYEAATGKLIRTISAPPLESTSLRFSRDGNHISAAMAVADSTIEWNLTRPDPPSYTPLNWWQRTLRYSPTGGYAYRTPDTYRFETGKLTIYESNGLNQVLAIEADPGGMRSIQFTANDRLLVTIGGSSDLIKCWELPSGQFIKSDSLPTRAGVRKTAQRISSSGRYLANGWEDGKITIIDLQSGKTVKTFSDYPVQVDQLQWAPDSKHLYSGSYDGGIVCWNVDLPE